MTITQSIFAKNCVSITDLRRNPSGVIEVAQHAPVAVLNHNKPSAYVVSAAEFEDILERLDNALLIQTVKQRRGGKTIKAKLADL